jgi:hypothetical protein
LWLPVALALAALTAAGLAYSSGGPAAQLDAQTRLYGGGGTDPGCFVPDIGFCRTGPTDISVDAHATGNGQAAYGNLNGRAGGRERVTCLAVDGNKASVGGVITADANPAAVGALFLMFFVDNGASGVDLASPLYNAPAGAGNWPAGFPYVCPSPDTGAPSFGLLPSFIPIVRGDIIVQDAP